MRFKKILHPEIVLGRRGDPKQIRFYKEVLSRMKWVDGELTVLGIDQNRFDPNVREHFAMCEKFVREHGSVYHVGRDFLRALAKIDRQIPIDRLPERFFGYVSFADDAIDDGEDGIQGAYVYIGPAQGTILNPKYQDSPCVLWVSYVCQPNISLPQTIPAIGKMLIDLRHETFESIVKDAVGTDFITLDNGSVMKKIGESPVRKNDVYRALINLVLFISNDENAEILKLPTTGHLSQNEKRRRSSSGQAVNECTMPVTLVSWNYHVPDREYTDQTVWVDSFMRWQRHGPQLSRVKLIMVKGHERRYGEET